MMMICKIDRVTLRLFGLCAFYVVYLFIGAAIFSAIEYENEESLINELRLKRQEFLSKNKQCLNETDLEAFISRIVEANSRGISAISNLTVEPNWSFGQAVFFAGTVLTTIGYGHVSPLSNGGKVFCIFYAIFGVPLTLIMISACVERLSLATKRIEQFMKEKMCSAFNTRCVTFTNLILVFTFVLVSFFLIPASIFSSIEKEWDYLDGLYYTFISLSTIGLGDYIPGDNYEQPYRVFYKIATTFYLIIGIMFVMLLINVITQIPELNLAKLFSIKHENDPERQYLSEAVSVSPSYSRQIDEDDSTQAATTSDTNNFTEAS